MQVEYVAWGLGDRRDLVVHDHYWVNRQIMARVGDSDNLRYNAPPKVPR
jgi:hypothetical protein